MENNKPKVYESKDGSFFVFKGNVLKNIQSVRNYIQFYALSLNDIEFVKMDTNTETYWKQHI